MKQLTGLDATFLYMETPSQFGHVSSLSVFERPDDPDYEPLAAWRAQIERRLHLLEPLRRRCARCRSDSTTRSGSTTPDFDLDFHVRNTADPAAGRRPRSSATSWRGIVGRPLDRTRPLWETYVIEGLPDDRFAILTKVHHATVDGASGAELLTLMLDADVRRVTSCRDAPTRSGGPSGSPSDARGAGARAVGRTSPASRAAPWCSAPARPASSAGRPATRRSSAAANQVRSSLRGPLGAVLNVGRDARRRRPRRPGPLPSLSAPRTPFNAPITPHRRFAFRSASLRVR